MLGLGGLGALMLLDWTAGCSPRFGELDAGRRQLQPKPPTFTSTSRPRRRRPRRKLEVKAPTLCRRAGVGHRPDGGRSFGGWQRARLSRALGQDLLGFGQPGFVQTLTGAHWQVGAQGHQTLAQLRDLASQRLQLASAWARRFRKHFPPRLLDLRQPVAQIGIQRFGVAVSGLRVGLGRESRFARRA